MDTVQFSSFSLRPETVAAIARKGFEGATPIQALTIPKLLAAGPDLIARARTGTGKTAAFGIPLVDRLWEPAGYIRALVLVPTRELALQVTGELVSLRSGSCPRVAAVYGGSSMTEQLRRIGAGVDIVVGTPGRVLDHLGRGTLDLSHLEFLVLDEADEMLDMGFIEDIEEVLEKSGENRRVVLFSATMPSGIVHVAKRRLGSYEVVEDSSEAVATELAEQVWLEVREGDKLEALCRVMDAADDFYGIVFTSTRVEAERIASALEERGYESDALHGEIPQDRRERILDRFRSRRSQVLVATDVAARGIDIDNLTHVVNWSLPFDAESYVHRVGRTGRAGNAGVAITLVTPAEYRKLFRFKKVAGSGFKKAKIPEVDDVLAARMDRLQASILARTADLAPSSEDSSEEAAEAAKAKPKDAKAEADKAALWLALSDRILERSEARTALAAVLLEAFGDDIDPARYGSIESFSVDAAATVRLFIGSGRHDHSTPARIASLIKKLSGLPDRLIGGIEVYEDFSFATVPFEAAQKVLFEAKRQGGLPSVRFASPKGQEGRRESGKGRDYSASPRRSSSSPRSGHFHGEKEYAASDKKPRLKTKSEKPNSATGSSKHAKKSPGSSR